MSPIPKPKPAALPYRGLGIKPFVDLLPGGRQIFNVRGKAVLLLIEISPYTRKQPCPDSCGHEVPVAEPSLARVVG